jgi:cytidylate kinase
VTDDLSWLQEKAQACRLSVAVDGPAGSGKTTVGIRLAALLNALLLDTGLMYREVTARLLRDHLDPHDSAAATTIASAVHFRLVPAKANYTVWADEDPLDESRLHRSEIDRCVSVVATHASVRSILVENQRRLASQGPIIMLGRDIGTVVLPSAPVKLFLTASPLQRAHRRAAQRRSAGLADATTEVSSELASRDTRDEHREVSPLRPAEDALIIDTTSLSIDETVYQALHEAVIPALDCPL